MNTKNDVGIIVGRFQVPDLHEAHVDLISQVIEENERVYVFLGLSPVKVTRNNPLDFESRKQMILQKFPKINVLYIKDVNDNDQWSRNLDNQINDVVGPGDSVVLYGGRDAFSKHYSGNFPVKEMSQRIYASGTDIRSRAGKSVKPNTDFRAGVIWSTVNRYENAVGTVDVAPTSVIDDELCVLVGKKRDENKLRFIGGFTSGTSSYEEDASRELFEESGGCTVEKLNYVCSQVVDDWRYRSEATKIVTVLFTGTFDSGVPRPTDDMEGGLLIWVPLNELVDQMMDGHKQLAEKLVKYLGEKS